MSFRHTRNSRCCKARGKSMPFSVEAMPWTEVLILRVINHPLGRPLADEECKRSRPLQCTLIFFEAAMLLWGVNRKGGHFGRPFRLEAIKWTRHLLDRHANSKKMSVCLCACTTTTMRPETRLLCTLEIDTLEEYTFTENVFKQSRRP